MPIHARLGTIVVVVASAVAVPVAVAFAVAVAVGLEESPEAVGSLGVLVRTSRTSDPGWNCCHGRVRFHGLVPGRSGLGRSTAIVAE